MDGVCYSGIAVAALAAAMAQRRPLLAFGAGAAAAALSKQGFVAVAMAGVAGTLTAEGRRVGRRPWSALLAYVGGAAAVCLPLVFVLGSTGALAAALQAVVTDPREVTREVLGYGNWELLVGMHLPSGTGLTVGGRTPQQGNRRRPWSRQPPLVSTAAPGPPPGRGCPPHAPPE
jgi:hypothetical protein